MNDELAFNSKIDLWLLILVLTVVTACIWGVARIWDEGNALLWPVALLLVAGVLLPLWIIVSLRYFLSDQLLRVRCGPFSWRIPLSEISNITDISSPYSSPAMSMDRVRIEYGDGRRVMISPEPRQEFLRQLDYRRKQLSAS